MASSSEKGNISPFLLIVAVVVIVWLLISIANIMVFKALPSGKYKNPSVATKIIEGNIYDVNGKTLSMQVPGFSCYFDLGRMSASQLDIACDICSLYANLNAEQLKYNCRNSKSSYIKVTDKLIPEQISNFIEELETYNLVNCVVIEKNFTRTYPSQYHCFQLIKETEKVLSNIISPKPSINATTTYGGDIYLTIDMDVQYLLDMAVEEVKKNVDSKQIVAFVVNAKTGAIVASTTFPYVYPEDDSYEIAENRAYLSEFANIKPYFIDKIVDSSSNVIANGEKLDYKKAGFSTDLADTIDLSFDSERSVTIPVPALEKPKYIIFMGATGSNTLPLGYLTRAASTIEAGLRAQSKI